MLVQFSCKNVLSFKEEAILDMRAVNAYKEHMSNLIEDEEKGKFLKVAAIYGANASGKTNLLVAFSFFMDIVKRSFDNFGDKSESVLYKKYIPFSIEKDNTNPSEFNIVFILGDYEYTYGFEYNADMIISEWCYRKSFVTKGTSTIVERDGDKILFGAKIRSACKSYKDQIPKETLVLSFFNKLNIKTDVFKTIFNEIISAVVILGESYFNINSVENSFVEIIDNEKDKLLQFLAAIDTGIKDIRYIEEKSKKMYITSHMDDYGNLHDLSLYSESEGTIKSIILFVYARIALRDDGVIFIDELNSKLHPLLTKFVVDLFYENDYKAQLVYTTHDVTLMDRKFFRRDQIYFVQKDSFGRSELMSLSDFKVRSDSSFEKDYLSGVYGGIPFLKDFDMKG